MIDMENKMTKNEFDIKTLLRVLVAFWLVIAIVTVLGGVIGGGYSLLSDKTTYTSYASFWVNANSVGGVSQSSTMGAAQLATNYVELADTTALLTRAVKDGNLAAKWNTTEDSAVKTLGSMISAGKTDADSLMFTVYIRSGNAQMTYDAISAVQQSMITVIEEVNGDSEVVRVAEVYSMDDVYASRPSALKKALIGAAAGFVLSYAICFAIYVFDKRARNAKDIATATSLSVVSLPERFYLDSMSKRISAEEAVCAYISAAERVVNLTPEGARTIAVTGASFADPDAVLSIAEVYAGNGINTLVIECDSRLPLIADMLGEDGEKLVGLDAFIAEGKMPTVINIDDFLDTVTVGAEGSGYLSCRNIRALVEKLSDGYERVLLSLPSAELMTDLSALARIADATVVSISYGDRIDGIENAERLLNSAGIDASAVYFLPL